MATKQFVKSKDDVVVVKGGRTAFGKFGGSLQEMPSVDIAAVVIKELVKSTGVSGDDIDELYYGVSAMCETMVDGKGDVPDRRAAIKAGLPDKTISVTVNRACCSSLVAIQMAMRAIRSGDARVAIGVGADNLGRMPYIVAPEARMGARIGHIVLYDNLYAMGYGDFAPNTVFAGQVALEYGISREMQDEWSIRSQQGWGKADAEGKFKDELIPIEIPQKKGDPIIFNRDEGPRPTTTIEALARLKPVYGSPTVTAGNAPGLSAGSAGAVLMTRATAEKYGLKPIATLLSAVNAALEPRLIAAAPAPSIEKALAAANISLDDIELIEINEAFAAMPLVSTKILADKLYKGSPEKLQHLRDITNVNGGAIAIGHPTGASGGRIFITLINELKRRGGGYGVASICGGLGQGTAAAVYVD